MWHREREREREREVYEQLDAVNYISKAEIIQKRRPSAKRASSNNTTANPIATAHTSLESSPTRVAIPNDTAQCREAYLCLWRVAVDMPVL